MEKIVANLLESLTLDAKQTSPALRGGSFPQSAMRWRGRGVRALKFLLRHRVSTSSDLMWRQKGAKVLLDKFSPPKSTHGEVFSTAFLLVYQIKFLRAKTFRLVMCATFFLCLKRFGF
jgi:hypothetical protein